MGATDAFGRIALVQYYMAVALALRGEREEAIRLAESSVLHYGPDRDATSGVLRLRWLALTYMLVGRRTDAVRLLERLLAIPSDITVHSLRMNPWWDGLRGEPAFERLIARTP